MTPEQTVKLLVRFQGYLWNKGVLVGDAADEDTAVAFLKAERAAAIREAAASEPDPRFTTPEGLE